MLSSDGSIQAQLARGTVKIGNIAFANSDATWDACANAGIALTHLSPELTS
jgi:hypothetical protein